MRGRLGHAIVPWMLVLGSLCPDSLRAQSREEPEDNPPADAGRPLGERWTAGARHLKEDGRYLPGFPRRRTRKGVVAASAVGGGVLALFFLDDEIREEVQEARTPSLDRWERRIQHLGDAPNTALAALATYGFGRLLRHEPSAETGRALLEALLFTEAFDSSAKGLFGRDPPGNGNRANEFFDASSAFPSGHTARAFAFATVLAERHGATAAWIAYPLATAVGLSRLERDVHWASDVLAGAALGHVIAKAVVRRREARALRVQISLPVTRDRGTAGVLLRIPLD